MSCGAAAVAFRLFLSAAMATTRHAKQGGGERQKEDTCSQSIIIHSGALKLIVTVTLGVMVDGIVVQPPALTSPRSTRQDRKKYQSSCVFDLDTSLLIPRAMASSTGVRRVPPVIGKHRRASQNTVEYKMHT
jgi:hypothetical protein